VRLRLWAIAGVLALAMVAVACGGSDNDNDGAGSTGSTSGTQAAGQATQATGGTQATTARVKRGGTLVAGLGNNPKTFDPMLSNDVASAAPQANILEPLYYYDENYKPVPWLAEKVDINADSTVFTFTMRQGVKFHDGTDLDAEAVKFSMDRIKNNAASPRNSDTKVISAIDVLDKMTVRLTLNEPFAPFPASLTGGLGYVVSPTAVRTMGDEKFGLNPVGTGPFKFGEWKNDVSVTLNKNEGYWKKDASGGALPYLDRVEFRIITEAATRLTALQSGDIDLFAANTNPRDADVAIIKRDSTLSYQEGPGLGWGGMWLTINKPPFDNKSLRQAVAFAIDREEINKAIYEGTRTLAHGPIPVPMKWAVDENYKPYGTTADAAKARAKLAEGGQPNGFAFEYWISAGDQTGQLLAELIKAQLAKVGITMNIQAADFNGVVIPKLMKQEGNAYQLGLTGGVDPDRHVSLGFLTGAGFNFFPYSNPQVDELIKKGRATSNQEERAKAYKDITRLIMEDAPYIWHTYSKQQITSNKKVQGNFLGPKATTGYAEFWKE
jgi:peptide/nickel transport system substrate-binding protein